MRITSLKLFPYSCILLFVVWNSLMAQETDKASPGAATFKAKCVLCHGADGSGTTPLGKQLQAADLRSKTVQKHTDAELQKVVHDGQANMPSFADQLTEDEIANVIKYVRELGKAGSAKKQ